MVRAEMTYQRRLPTLLLIFILCFSPWPTSGYRFYGHFEQQCYDDCPIKHYTLKYGVQCTDACEQRGYDYYWCNSQKGWDYCSPSNNVDYKGNPCLQDHPCGKHGEDYYWCNLVKGGWDYCAPVLPKTTTHQTRYQEDCIGDCQYKKNGDYFWCYTENSWGYCSPIPHLTYKGESCRSDHKCITYDQSYSWCYTTDNDDWDYCGFTSDDDCKYSLQRRRKRTPNDPNEICSWTDNNGREITATEQDARNNIADCSNRLRREALDLINEWNNQRLGNQARSNLISSDNLRIDLQGVFNVDNQLCYNLQIQVNKPRCRGESTTLSQIICPVDTPAEQMRWAFKRSLEKRTKVILRSQ
ncbi:uncharacterized protein [Trachinotus anak]|uniref:uncharacterized protein n=1 Tax=Trachinotus anak TaxID=443729 RepID=UPI0039F1FA3D